MTRSRVREQSTYLALRRVLVGLSLYSTDGSEDSNAQAQRSEMPQERGVEGGGPGLNSPGIPCPMLLKNCNCNTGISGTYRFLVDLDLHYSRMNLFNWCGNESLGYSKRYGGV